VAADAKHAGRQFDLRSLTWPAFDQQFGHGGQISIGDFVALYRCWGD